MPFKSFNKNSKIIKSYKTKRSIFTFAITAVTLLSFPKVNFGQAPDLGATSGFALFTAVGAITNTGATYVTGDVGTNDGAFNAFPPGTLIGQIHVADATSAQAAIDVAAAYSDLLGRTCGTTLPSSTLGSGQVLTPNVYCLVTESTLTGDLILDGQGDCNALFIFKIDGAFSTGTSSNVLLINGAQAKNVYWQINGAFSLGGGSVFRGTVVANGAIGLLAGSSLFGRGLTKTGAITLNAITATITRNLWKGGGTDNWNTASNWIPGVVPSCSLAINAEIPNGATPYPVISSTGNYADNLTIQSGATLTINPGKDLTVCGCTEIYGLNALILKSDVTGTASFIDNGISGGGTAKMERYLSTDAWHYISSPISDATANIFFGDYLRTSDPSTTTGWSGYILNTSTPLEVMRGYACWKPASNPGLESFTGTLNTGDKTFTVTNNGSGTFEGWHLVGNPYPSAVDLTYSGISWGTFEATAYFWDQSGSNGYTGGGNYNVYPTSGTWGTHNQFAPATQGFYIHNGTPGLTSFTIPNLARVHSSTAFLKSIKSITNGLLLTASGYANNYTDKISVHFNPDATSGYDPGYDAYKLWGLNEAPQLYTRIGDTNVTCNSLPFENKNMVIPMGFSCSLNGQYTLKADSIGTFASNIDISLEDLKLSTTQDLKLYPSYTFTYDTLDNANRFVLHFSNPSFGIEDKKIDNPVQIYSFGSSVYIKSTEGTVLSGDVFISDIIGRELYRGHLVSNTLNRITPAIDEGYYVVKVVTNNGVYLGKIYLEN